LKQIIDDLYLLNRSLISDDYDRAIAYIDELLDMEIHEYPSGTRCWTWEIPQKWTVNEAWVEANGERIIDFHDHPLHLWTGSLTVDRVVSREELSDHLAWNEQQPQAIPYKFNFYELTWGFSLSYEQYEALDADEYHVHIDTEYSDGMLKVGDATVEGTSDEVVILMAHLDHPGQANDGLSGVAVGVKLIEWLRQRETHYTYKLLVLPETIGSIAYFSHNMDLIPNCRCGIFLEMMGNDNQFAFQHSRQHDDFIDLVARRELVDRFGEGNFTEGAFRKVVGNDEMVLNGPGVNVPTISISRWPYWQYHTHLDNIEMISEKALAESLDTLKGIINIIESDFVPRRKFTGPIFLSGHGLWVDYNENYALNRAIEQIMLSLEGDQSIVDIAAETDVTYTDVHDFVQRLVKLDLAENIGRGADLDREA
jgi:aminopeptidase-like protein